MGSILRVFFDIKYIIWINIITTNIGKLRQHRQCPFNEDFSMFENEIRHVNYIKRQETLYDYMIYDVTLNS